MKKTGILCMILGAAAAAALFLLRQTGWYLSEASRNLSETAEFIESAFWASLIVIVLGVLLFLFGLRKKREPCATEEPEFSDETDEPYEFTPYDDSTDAYDVGSSDNFDSTRRCGEEESMHSAQWVCDFCGTQNPDFSRFCAICGGKRA